MAMLVSIGGQEPAYPGHTVRDGLLLCPGFPQYGNVFLCLARLEVQRRHTPASRLIGMLFLRHNTMLGEKRRDHVKS